MGRKIPGAKHRGVKDVAEHLAKRNALLQKKINAPPKDASVQEIPKRVQQITQLKNDAKQSRFKRKQKRQRKFVLPVQKDNHISEKRNPTVTVPKVNYHPELLEQEYLNSVHQENKKLHPGLDEEPVGRKQKNKINRTSQDVKQGQQGKPGKQVAYDTKGHLSKNEKRKLKVKQKKMLQQKEKEETVDFSDFRDDVHFGEVVHQPPSLNPPLKRGGHIANISTKRPGKRDLLLKNMIQPLNTVAHKSMNSNLTGKRKNLPAADQRILEQQRKQAVEAYRLLKSNKQAK